ncbi:MAG: hypothetical protein IJW24_03675 [Clostridia bacterium]|nr:hypothetical protein [Clostridia bacterium]
MSSVSKNGGAFYNSGGTVSIQGGSIEYCFTTSAGGAIYNSGNLIISGDVQFLNNKTNGYGGTIRNNGTLDMTGGTIDGSSTYFANRGGGVFNAGTFNMSAGTIKNYLGRQFGAGVYNTGTFNISGTALLTNNDSHPSYTIDGGNVYNSGTINMTGGNISNGNAKNGGNIFNEATLFISDGTISGGVASIDGGNIFNELSLEMTGGTVTNGVAVNGGGIYSDYYSGDAERMYISDVTIRDCTATKYGGGAYFFSYDLSLDSFDVSGCTAEYGGALYVVGDNSVCDVLIDDCVANTSGGGIYMGDPGGYIRGVITNSRAINGGGVFLNNNLYCYLEDVQISQCSAEFGGGVFSYSSSIRFYDNSTGFIKNNTATQGAGIYLDNATIHLEQTSGFVIGENTATLGGGLFVNGCDVNADKYSSLNIESNNAEKGAGIYVNENSTFSMTALKIVNNAAKDGNYGHGGGIYNAGVLYMNSGEILGDGATVNAYAGGGIYNTGSLDLFGGKISDCVASANGGGIYLEGGEITYHGTDFSIDLNLATLGGGLFVNGGVFGGQDNSNESAYLTISSNKAEKGAGVYVDNNVSLEIKDPIKILNNSATAGGVTNGLGGGIYNAGNLVMSAGEILGNSKTVNAYAGGGIYNAGTAALSGGKISGCVASTYGGGFDNAGEATFSGVEISACISEDRGGGCFVRKSSLLTIENETLISSNIAQKGGGVTIVSTGSMIMNGGMIAKNHLSIANNNGRGGQVYLQTDTSNFTMNGGTISGNDGEQSQFIPSVEDYNAYDGGGVYNNGTFTMNGGEILNCSGIRGGALYNVGTFNMYAANEPMIYSNFGRSGGAIYSVSSTLNLLGGYISVNYASNHGSAVYATGSTMEIDGTFIDDNCLTADNPSSTNAGHGTVTFSGGTAVMKSGSISNNRILSGAIQPYGGGVYVTGSAVFTVTGGSFEGNCIVADESSGGTFHVNSSATLNINGVTIKGDNDEIVATNGGAISNYGTVNIVDTYIEGCKSNVAGGAIMNWGTLTVSGLSLYGCSTTIGIGDSIATMGELRIDGNIVCQNLDVAVGSNNAEVNNFYDLRSTGNIVIASSMDIEKFNISFFSSDVSTTSYDDESGLYYGLDTTLFEVFDYFNIEEHPYSNALFVHYFKDFSYNNVIPLNEEMISFENGVSRDVFDFVLPAGFELVSHDDGGYFLGLETHLVIIVDSFGENLGQILATSFSSVHFIFNDNGFLDCIGYEDFSRQIYDEPIQTENDLYVTYEASGDTNRIIEDIEICLKVKEFSLKIINDASQQVLYEGTFLSGANVELTSSTVSVNEAVVCRTTDYEEDGYSFVADGVFYNQFGEYVTYTTILLNEDLILYAQYTRYECFVVNLNFMKQYYLGDGSLEFSDENLYNRESFVSLDAASIVINQGNVQLLRNGSEVIFEFAYDYYDDGYRVGNITISINGVSGQYTEGQTINIPSGGAGETINVDVLVNYEKEIWLQIFNSENGESLFENTYYGSVTVDLTYTKVSVNGVVVFEATYYESDGNYYVPTYGFTNTQGDDISNSTIVMYEDLKIIAQYYISIDEA